MPARNICELLAPAGGKEALAAAVQNGADAVYFGATSFSARAGAENFASVKETVAYCHLRGVRAYLAVNTLVRDEEMDALDAALTEASDAGVDALIVQDIAVAVRARQIAPGIPLHLSTQGGVTGPCGAAFARRLGFERVVLARECSLSDIRAVADTGVGAEVFAHGALCVSYSGRCLFSSVIGGRSGNRGRCAQPCRLPYQLADTSGCLLSPRDLCALGELPMLIGAGACAIKIEGRMRRPEYVALATAAYRRALDAALAGQPCDAAADSAELYKVFNRGAFTRGYALGDNDAALMNPERPGHAGVQVGEIGRDGTARLAVPLRKGDSVECRPSGAGFAVERDFPAGRTRLTRGMPGDTLHRTNDAALNEKARASYAQERRATQADAVLRAVPGERARLTLGDITVEGGMVEAAQNRALTREDARRQIAKLGESPLILGDFRLEGEGAFLPVAQINALRREAVAAWERARLKEARLYPVRDEGLPDEGPGTRYECPAKPLLIAQTSDPDRIGELLAAADEVYLAPRDWRRPALETALAALPDDARARLVLPFWMDDVARIADMLPGSAVGFVAGSFAAMQALGEGYVTDHTVHAFSALAARSLRALGAERVTLSPELTLAQMRSAAARAPCEAIVHGDFPLMTLRHCPIRAARGLSAHGREACGICGGREQALTDRKGEKFPLRRVACADGCRVEVYNAHRLYMLDRLDNLARAGLSALRVISDDPSVAQAYRAALDGKKSETPPEGGITRGHFFRGVE